MSAWEHVFGTHEGCGMCQVVRLGQNYLAWKVGVVVGIVVLQYLGWWRG